MTRWPLSIFVHSSGLAFFWPSIDQAYEGEPHRDDASKHLSSDPGARVGANPPHAWGQSSRAYGGDCGRERMSHFVYMEHLSEDFGPGPLHVGN